MNFSSEFGEYVQFPAVDEGKLRMVGLYGPLSEKKAAEIVHSMKVLEHTGTEKKYQLTDEQKEAFDKAEKEDDLSFSIPEEEIAFDMEYEPFEFILSTGGGIAVDMLAIYDTMRSIQNNMEIHTHGIGKVMSAGVPLLAAGTKGKRKIGKNCRVMIHAVQAGAAGPMHDMEAEFQEIQHLQEKYIEILVNESNMTVEQVVELLNTRTNCYLSAEEAVEYGLADIIV